MKRWALLLVLLASCASDRPQAEANARGWAKAMGYETPSGVTCFLASMARCTISVRKTPTSEPVVFSLICTDDKDGHCYIQPVESGD